MNAVDFVGVLLWLATAVLLVGKLWLRRRRRRAGDRVDPQPEIVDYPGGDEL